MIRKEFNDINVTVAIEGFARREYLQDSEQTSSLFLTAYI